MKGKRIGLCRSWLLLASCFLLFMVISVSSDQRSSRRFSQSSRLIHDFSKTNDYGQSDGTMNKDTIPAKISLLKTLEGVSSSCSYRNHRIITNAHPFLSREKAIPLRGGSEATNGEIVGHNVTSPRPRTEATSSSLPVGRMDTQARSFTIALAWVVFAQALFTVFHSCREQVFEVCCVTFVVFLECAFLI